MPPAPRQAAVWVTRLRPSVAGGLVRTYGYDVYGRDTLVTQTGLPSRRTQYDVLNRVTAAYDGVNANPTTFAYDSVLLRQVTDPKGQVYQYAYNALGWVTQQVDPLGNAEAYQYSRDGDVRRWTNRRAQHTDYAYDVLHRTVSKSGAWTATDSVHYSTDGRVVTAFGYGVTPATTETTYLNVRGQPDSIYTVLNGWGSWRRYQYTAAGLLDSVWASSSSGAIFLHRKYVYDTNRGVLEDIKLGTRVTHIALKPDLVLDSLTFSGGDVVKREHTTKHGPSAVTTSATYRYDVQRYAEYEANGRMFRHLSDLPEGLTRAAQFGYDGLGRLIVDSLKERTTGGCYLDPDGGFVCSNPGAWYTYAVKSFAYDEVGNRTSQGGTYATGNRITAFDGCSYQTDLDGNVTQRTCGTDVVMFWWSSENRLDSVAVNGATVRLGYDGGGRLARLDSAGVVRYLLWDGANLFAELDATGSKRAEYSYYPGLDNLHALVVGTTPYYAHRDLVGNVIALTDENQGVQRTYGYPDEWGDGTFGSDNRPFNGVDRARWKGALAVPELAGLYYMRNRWYEPRSGRFLTQDPLGLSGDLNPYVFGHSDPVNYADPLGLESCPVDSWVAIVITFKDGTRLVEFYCDTDAGLVPLVLDPVFVAGDAPGGNPLAALDELIARADAFMRQGHHGWDQLGNGGGTLGTPANGLSCVLGAAGHNFVETNSGTAGFALRTVTVMLAGARAAQLQDVRPFLPGVAWEVFNRNVVLHYPAVAPSGSLGRALINVARPALRVAAAYETGVAIGSAAVAVRACSP